MTILEFMYERPLQTFFLVILFLAFIDLLLRSFIIVLRFMNIRKHGWPPEHLDADGNFLSQDDNEEQL